MFHDRREFSNRVSWPLVLSVLALVAFMLSASVRSQAQTRRNSSTTAASTAAKTVVEDGPVYNEYKGVRIGMTADEARKKLGAPKDKADDQDFYIFGEKETAQILYDKSHQVVTISVDYMGGGGDAPLAKAVLGAEPEAKPDGSIYKLVRYQKAGYWVSYNRTAGESPLVTVTLQKIQ